MLGSLASSGKEGQRKWLLAYYLRMVWPDFTGKETNLERMCDFFSVMHQVGDRGMNGTPLHL